MVRSGNRVLLIDLSKTSDGGLTKVSVNQEEQAARDERIVRCPWLNARFVDEGIARDALNFHGFGPLSMAMEREENKAQDRSWLARRT